MFDESDEILSHKYKLQYSTGSPCALESRKNRWNIAESILSVIETDETVRSILNKQNVFIRDIIDFRPEAFNQIRIIGGDKLK